MPGEDQREGLTIGTDRHHRDDRDLFAELNEQFKGRDDNLVEGLRQRGLRFILKLVALLLASVFLLTVTGRYLAVYSGPAYHFLRESWLLSADPLVREVRPAIGQVFVEKSAGSGGGSLRGSGFNIDESGLVVTNRHLVEDAALVRVSFPGYGIFLADRWVMAADVDLALLFIRGEGLPVLHLANEALQTGEEVLVIGNPLQFARVANRGTVVSFRPAGESNFPQPVIEAMIYPGSSGSPVINSAGKVAAVIFATMGGQDPDRVRGLAVDGRELAAFLDSLKTD